VRKSLIKTIFEIGGAKLHQSTLTLHTAVAYLDQVLAFYESQKQKELAENPEAEPQKVGRYSLELTAIGCVFIASKFDELDNNIPFLKDFIKAAKFMFKYDEII